MAIAIIGWGSLIWAPGELPLASRWHPDGPLLPVEFARISKRDRLTLVISEFAPPQRTYWALAPSEDIWGVVSAVQSREGTKHIHHATSEGHFCQGAATTIRKGICEWLHNHPDLKACVWTGLESNWLEKRGKVFSVEDALSYIRELSDSTAVSRAE